jgi:hypothetical protein
MPSSFFAAAEATDEAIGDQPGLGPIAPVPVIFLTARAIELGLKAYLIHCGVSLAHIVDRLGHDLEVCLEEAERHDFSDHARLNDEDRQVLHLLNDSYRSKDLEYFFRGSKTLPEHGPLQTTAVRILDGVAEALPEAHLLLETKAGMIYSAIHRSTT